MAAEARSRNPFTVGLTAAICLRALLKTEALLRHVGVRLAHDCDRRFFLDVDVQRAGDRVYKCAGVEFFVDHESIPYLKGLHLDISNDSNGFGFLLMEET